jgi:O-antigen/teichoic acid export membrane protein
MPEIEGPADDQSQVSRAAHARTLRTTSSILDPSAVLGHLRTPLYANAYYLMANTVLLSLSGFLFWAVATRLYSTSDVGIGSALISASTLLAAISGLGLGIGLIRFLPNSKQPWPMINTCVLITLIVSTVIGLVFVSGVSVWSPDLAFVSQRPILLVGFVVFTAGASLSTLLDNLFVAQRRAGFTALKNLFIGFGRIPFLGWLALSPGAFGIFGSIGIVTVPTVAIALRWVRHRIENPPGSPRYLRREVIATLLPFSLANYVAGLVYRAPAMLLPLMVLGQLGPEANASFYISWMLGGLLCVIPNGISQSLFAEGSHFEHGLRSDAIRAIRTSFLLLLPVELGALLLAERLLMLFGAAYAEAGALLFRILALAALPILVNTAYFTVKRIEKQMAPIVALSALIAVGTLGLSHLLIPRLGLESTGLGWLVSQTVVAILVGLSLVKRRWYDRGTHTA